MAVQFACFVKASIQPSSQFTRKGYFYPDLPKGYQITQYKNPFASRGIFMIQKDGGGIGISISRINLEEDAGKSIHGERDDSCPSTYLDFNRSGIPLLEIVTAPELRSPDEAMEFIQQLRTSLQYLKICDGDMETGSLRCDANLSVRKRGDSKLGTRVELKNLNSFRFLTRALKYEHDRQVSIVHSGQTVKHETRSWDEKRNITLLMRSKEEDQDYQYFPEPDLPPLTISPRLIREINSSLPEGPMEKMYRLCSQYNIPIDEARILSRSRDLADYFESAAKESSSPPQVSRWILRDVLNFLNRNNIEIGNFKLSPVHLAHLIDLIENKSVSLWTAREKIFPKIADSDVTPESVLKGAELGVISDDKTIIRIARKVLEANPNPVNEYSQGKTEVISFFIGQMMQKTGGRIDPEAAKETLKRILKEFPLKK